MLVLVSQVATFFKLLSQIQAFVCSMKFLSDYYKHVKLQLPLIGPQAKAANIEPGYPDDTMT